MVPPPMAGDPLVIGIHIGIVRTVVGQADAAGQRAAIVVLAEPPVAVAGIDQPGAAQVFGYCEADDLGVELGGLLQIDAGQKMMLDSIAI